MRVILFFQFMEKCQNEVLEFVFKVLIFFCLFFLILYFFKNKTKLIRFLDFAENQMENTENGQVKAAHWAD